MTTVANVLVTVALSPFLTALLARAFIGRSIPARTWLAIAMAGAGIAWMYGGQMDLSSHIGGTLVALMVPLASASNWTVVQHSRAHGKNVDLVPAVLLGAVISTLALPLSLPFSATAHDIGLLALLGLVQLAIPCVLLGDVRRRAQGAGSRPAGAAGSDFGILLACVRRGRSARRERADGRRAGDRRAGGR